MRRSTAVLSLMLLTALAACGEREQSTANAKRRADTPAWQSASSPFTAPGYTPGDKTAWEAQLRERAQSQNDYAPRK